MREKIDPIHAAPEQGLSVQQVQERTAAGWISGEPAAPGKTPKQVVLSHCLTFFNLIFLVLAGLLVIARSSVMNMGFLVVVVINTVIGIVQELRARKAVEQLTLMARHPVHLVRDGQLQEVTPDRIVRDDIAEFGPGDQICGDGILRSGKLWVNESQITGEEDSVVKQPGDPVHSGTYVVSGRGRAELTAVGEDCAAAAIAREAKKNPHARKSEMMRSLDRLILFVGAALVPIGIVLFYQEYSVLNLGLQKSAEGTVAALTGIIPEGLYLLTSVALALASLKLSRRRILVQDRGSIEALARVDVLCVDKTGTITEPDMDVESVVPLFQKTPEELREILTAMYGSVLPDNATARALAAWFQGDSDWKCTARIPFSSETKWSGCAFAGHGNFVVGAPDFLLDAEAMDSLSAFGWAAQGYRVLLAAEYKGNLLPGKLDSNLLEPLAFILLTGRLRPNAKETFSYFTEQGVSIRVISGDHPAAVSQIALQAGIPGGENYVDASELKEEKDYREAVKKYTVFGRVTPPQKKALIEALQKQGHTVAMTGDGVNDLLALKQADCSVAMASGAEAASRMASLVLLDSDFSAMPDVVAEGRRVINNIQRAATLFLVKNIFSLFLSVISLFTNWPYPLMPVHLTVISTLTIGIPSYALTLEPRYDRIRGHFLRGVLRRAFPGGLTNVFVVLICQAFMQVFHLPASEVTTVCAAILGVVGLLVLYQVCKPVNRFRGALWCLMAAGLVICFTLFGELFHLRTWSVEVELVMFTLLVMTPTVFFAVQRGFDYLDLLAEKSRSIPRRLLKGRRNKKC